MRFSEPTGWLEFTPTQLADGGKHEDLGVAEFRLAKRYGVFRGQVRLDGQDLKFDRLYGFVESMKARW